MSIIVSFSGNSYSIPTDGDESWSELTDYLVALSTAATTTSMNYSARIDPVTNVSVLPTDTIVLVSATSASVVTVALPSASVGQFIGVYDYSNNAGVNNITVNPPSPQTINGATSYTISSNYGGLFMQYVGNDKWIIISESSLDVLLRTVYRKNDLVNGSVIEGGVVAQSQSFPLVADGQSCTLTISGTNHYKFWVSLSDGRAFSCTCDKASADISSPSDPDAIFLIADAGTGVYVSKPVASNIITLKSRLGIPSVNIEIHTETGSITPTAWS